MKTRRICSILVLIALMVSTLVSCGAATPLVSNIDPTAYPSDAQAEDLGISSNLGDIRVMSFNLQNTVSSDATLKENRYLAVSGQIMDYAPTLLGLQEDGAHWNTYLTDVLVNNGNYKRINNSKVTSEYCSIYYDASVLGTPIASGADYLSYDGTQSSKYSLKWSDIPDSIRKELNMTEYYYKLGKTGPIYNSDSEKTEAVSVLTSRLMTYGIFELNGQKFLYVNTHLTHRSQNSGPAVDYPAFLQLRELARMKEWDIIHSNVTKLLEKYGDMPVVITGDLNEVPGSASYLHYATHYDDAAKQAKIRKGPDGSWNAVWNSSNNGVLMSTSIKKDDVSENRYKENQATSTLDYCFISPNDFTVEQYQVAANTKLITNSTGATGYVAVSDHLAIITDLRFGAKTAPVTLEKPGFETSAISYYDPAVGYEDYSWFDNACMTNTDKHYTFTLTTANQLLSFINLRQMQTKATYFFDNVTIKLGANMVFNELKDGISVLSGPDDLKTKNTWIALNSSFTFKGVFDGQGHYISGVVFNCGTGGAKGLLGAIGGNAEVKNFSLLNTYMTTPTGTGKNRMGSIAPFVVAGSDVLFHNIYSDAIIVPPSADAPSFEWVGGILGMINTASKVTFEYCTFSGEVLAKGSKVGGIVGRVENAGAQVYLFNCINSGKISGGKYTGGLIGFANAAVLYVNNCANIGEINGNRCSGGLIGTISECPDLVIANCAVNAKLDFSSIEEGSTEDSPISVPAGCQVGGLIGRTYAVDGTITCISLAGSMKGAANIITDLDKGSNDTDTNYLASGAITGFNSCYADDEGVKNGKDSDRVFSHIHYSTIMVSMEMEDVESYLGGTRDTPINSNYSKISHRDVVYDKEKYAASDVMSLWGYRIDKDRAISSSGETAYNQLSSAAAFSGAMTHTAEGLNAKVNISSGKALNYTPGTAKFYVWKQVNGGVLVPTAALRDLMEETVKNDVLWTLGYQTKANEKDPATTDYRFVSVMNDTSMTAVGYHVTLSYINADGVRVVTEKDAYCPTVYALVMGGGETYVAKNYGGEYIFTLVIEGVPAESEACRDIMVTVQTFAAEKNGEEIVFTDYAAKTYFLG